MSRKNGIYGANVAHWSERHWELLRLGRFRWIIVRSDCDISIAKELYYAGIEVIIQLPDRFNKNPWQSPGVWADRCIEAANRFRSYAHMIVLDNEPNLYQDRADRWHAEQFTRWYRALLALFRFYDHGSHWTVLFPGLSPRIEVDPLMWLRVNRENVLESPAIATHIYWPDPINYLNPEWGRFYLKINALYPNRGQYVTEYGCDQHGLSPRKLGVHYRTWIDYLPHYVKCACLFILGGTPDWQKWHLQEETAQELGRR